MFFIISSAVVFFHLLVKNDKCNSENFVALG